MDIRNYLNSKGWKWKEVQRPKGLTATMNCPFCDDKEQKFAISLVDGAFSCLHLNNCGRKGSWWDLQKALGDKPQLLDNDNHIIHTSIKYNKPIIKSQKPDKATEYCRSRNLNDTTIKKFKIGQFNNELMFPYFKNGELVNVKYRLLTEKKFRQEKNAEPVLFGRDLVNGDMLIICEGEFDAMSLWQYGLNAVSIPSGANDLRWIEHEWNYLQQFQRIYLSLDNDTAGQAKIEDIVNRLGRWRCYHVILPYKDANECLMQGVEKSIIQEAIENARNFDPVQLKKATDYEDEIVDTFEHPEKMYGIETPWTGLNNILKGWRECELTIWSGRNSSGKSTILNDVIYGLIKHNQKIIMASLEMPPRKYLRWMLLKIKQKAYLERQEIREGLIELHNLFIYDKIGETHPNELINIFDFAARKYGVKHFFIDSLMKIILDPINELKEQKIFCNALIDKLAMIYNGHIHLVAHPRKGNKDSDKPDKVDVSGTGDITNLAHNVLMIYRATEEEKEKGKQQGYNVSDTTLYIKKNREWGKEGHVNFSFNEETKTFTECV